MSERIRADLETALGRPVRSVAPIPTGHSGFTYWVDLDGEGIAGMHPVRYGCPPEITRFVLRTARPSTVRLGLESWDAQARRREAMERDWV